jgi:2-keto-4-pentenoate hydratase/2-oxohepta-3-ene-1,7-dioic acid hydratase in catechol pathway
MITALPGISNLRPGAIYCIGRNYAEHAKELNNPIPKSPIIFMKPTCSLLESGGTVQSPEGSQHVHHEAELVVAIGKQGKHIPVDTALEYIAGYAIGIDVTARDIQDTLKSAGKPWLLAKGLDTFAPLGNFVTPYEITDPSGISIQLWVNDVLRQHGNTRDMIFPVHDLISRLSHHFTLFPGDLIYTGTPEGVGPMQHGDTVRAVINNGSSSVNVSVSNSR